MRGKERGAVVKQTVLLCVLGRLSCNRSVVLEGAWIRQCCYGSCLCHAVDCLDCGRSPIMEGPGEAKLRMMTFPASLVRYNIFV